MAETRHYPADALERFAAQACRALGADPDVAAEVAGHLVRANLAGHDSHGMLRLPQYVAQADRGALRPGARPEFVREAASIALVDAGWGFGHFSTAFALDWALEAARRHGIAAAAIRRSNHIGRLGEYAERAARRGLIALVTVGSAGPTGGVVLPHGGRERFLGTNPWAIGVPAAGRGPMIFDAATSVIAQGKIHVARAAGASLPPGCIVDRDGRPSTAVADYDAGGALLPVGSPGAGHKGYGLALASALLGGLALAAEPEPGDPDDSTPPDREGEGGRIGGVFVAAIDPGAFGSGERYAALVGATLDAANRVPPATGVEAVLTPGEPEARMRERRGREGIPLPAATWDELRALAARFDLPLLEAPEAAEAEGPAPGGSGPG